MDLKNNDFTTVNKPPVHNTQIKPLPPHSDPKEGFTGAEVGPNGRMGNYSEPLSNNE